MNARGVFCGTRLDAGDDGGAAPRRSHTVRVRGFLHAYPKRISRFRYLPFWAGRRGFGPMLQS